jgi:hypothetical protein
MGCRCSLEASVRRGLNKPEFKPWHSFAASYNKCSTDMVRVERHKPSQMTISVRSIISSKHSCQQSSIPRLKKDLNIKYTVKELQIGIKQGNLSKQTCELQYFFCLAWNELIYREKIAAFRPFRIIKFKAASIAKGKTQDDRDLKILYTLENILGSKDMETREKTVMIF